jgi:predicted Zn-ribbon and HTH transcriptional regulator
MNLTCQVCGYHFNTDYYEPDGKCPGCGLSDCLSEGGMYYEEDILQK